MLFQSAILVTTDQDFWDIMPFIVLTVFVYALVCGVHCNVKYNQQYSLVAVYLTVSVRTEINGDNEAFAQKHAGPSLIILSLLCFLFLPQLAGWFAH